MVPYREGRLRFSLLAAAVIGLMSLLMALNAEALGPRIVGARWLLVVVGLFLLASAIRSARQGHDKGSYLALSPLGFHSQVLGSGAFVPWEAVVEARLGKVDRQPSLHVDVTHPAAIVRSGASPVLAAVERAVTGDGLNISLAGLSLPPDVLTTLLHHYIHNAVDRPALGSTLDQALGRVTFADAD